MKHLIFISLHVLFIPFLYAQTAKKEFNRAYTHLKYEEWRAAVPFLEKGFEYEPTNIEINFWLGKCYWLTGKKDKCLPLFEKVIKSKPDFDEMLPLYYAEALHFSMKFDDAIKAYQKLRENYKPTSQEFLKLSNYIAQCNSGKILVKKPVKNIKIENAGPNINSEFPDFAPVVTADESEMIFTSRRKGNLGDLAPDGFPFEDLYVSQRLNNKTWGTAKNMGQTINTTGHDACIAVSADGQKLFIFRDDNGGDAFESKLKGDKWVEPKNLGKKINTKYWEPSVYMTADEKSLFFVSNKPGGLGGRDIYVCQMQKDGTWSEGVNLGPEINTPFDDDAPFLHPDGRTFYFSSEGHNSMGGFDIFKAEWIDKKWTKPSNLGYPINTTDDDIYFVISASGRHGYYASSKAGGMGEKDIYRISFEPPKLDSLVTINQNNKDSVKTEIAVVTAPALTMLKGIITDEKTGLPLEANIFVIDNEKNDTIFELTSNSASGKYLVTLPSGKNYGIVVQHPNYVFHSENIDIPHKTDFSEVEKNVPLKSLIKGTKIVLRNIFFDFDKATLRPASVAELERLHKILVEHPTMKIKIGGHTDNVGSDEYNQKLSENRSKSVVEWLIKNGIAQERLQFQGYGEKVAIDTNETEDGRQNNRRTEFEVMEN